MAEKKTKTFVIGILHRHGNEIDSTLGKLEAEGVEDALMKSEFWVAKKRIGFGCGKPGNRCTVDIREGYTGLKSTFLACSAEEISQPEA